MFAEKLNTWLMTALDRPDLRVVAEGRRIEFDASLDTAFRADPGGGVVLGAACLGSARVCAFHIRHALELSMLLDVAARSSTDPLLLSDLPILAGLCAARTAALFWQLDGPADEAASRTEPVSWLGAMASDQVPDEAVLHRVWTQVRNLQGSCYRLLRAACLGIDDSAVPVDMVGRLASIWHLQGPAEALMGQGGDQRLAVDPATGLNHYGCSHRPRPWAITFASSTASSLSERGFRGAEVARLRLAAAAFCGHADAALATEAQAVREAIGAHFGLRDDARTVGSEVVLAASGTDCELLALALAGSSGAAGNGVSNILMAPEETGTGVPLAAAGRHFADDTSGRQRVRKGDPVAGFGTDTRVLSVAIRGGGGGLRHATDIAEDCLRLAWAEHAAGRHVLLHLLDLSKTGLLAPSPAALDDMQGGERFDVSLQSERLDVVVDACQARIDPGHVRDYLARGWMVMITGSKFFTGPPFCGALLLPRGVAQRLQAGALPAGLAAYSNRNDWPAQVPATQHLPDAVNHGMVLRWHAALAEMQAFQAVPEEQLLQRLVRFLGEARAAIDAHPDLELVEVAPPQRKPGASWDRLQTILSFMILGPSGDGDRLPLPLERARRLYRWLNADVSPALPGRATPAERALARLLCHVGQPVPVAHEALGGAQAGALRISAGARVVSGEPSHGGLGSDDRIAREIADMRRVLDKITLLLRYWPAMALADPEPRYAPLPDPDARATAAGAHDAGHA
nr:hypothetical protein [uncultured Lichenicoccus sp.]